MNGTYNLKYSHKLKTKYTIFQSKSHCNIYQTFKFSQFTQSRMLFYSAASLVACQVKFHLKHF